jgi:pimeloyl-ACP methyl ester carboxylesterase
VPPTEIVVVIPGIMGSVLETPAGDQVWPAKGCGLMMQFTDADVDALLRDDLRATDLIRSVSMKSVYRRLLDLLDRYGYKEATAQAPAATLYAWPYDWRRDLRETAVRLADFLDGVAAAREDVELTLIAHSMGGLVARTYLETPQFSARPARGRVRRLVTLATPHRGAAVALAHITGQLGKLWLSAAQVRRVVNHPSYPSTYQLLPPDDEPFIWDRRARFEPVALDTLEHGLGLNAQSLKAMRDWRAQLDRGRSTDVRLFCFLGSTHDTVTSAWISRFGGGVEIDFQARPSAGDATVPFTSATLPGFQHFELEGEHGDIFHDDLVDTLLPRILGKTPVLAMSATGAVQLSLAQPIFPRSSAIRGVLVLRHEAGRARRLRGSLQLVPQVNWPWEGRPPLAMAAQTFEVVNIQSERLAFALPSPPVPGAYAVRLRLDFDGRNVELEEPVGIRQDR